MIRRLDSDMGGTRMEEALTFAYESHLKNRDKEREGYLFLITDGEVYDHENILKSAKKSEMIHFVVGVGYAADSALLSKLATNTRGSYEGMDPNEKMDDAILALFKKIDYPKAHDIQIEWPGEPLFEHKPDTLFDGDTLYAMAHFKEKPQGEAVLSYRLDDESLHHNTVGIGEAVQDAKKAKALTGIVVSKEIDTLTAKAPRGNYDRVNPQSQIGKKIIDYSMRYQLFSELTNYILIDEVAESEKPKELPTTHRVEHMVAENAISYSMSAPRQESRSHEFMFEDLPSCLSFPGISGGVLSYNSTPEVSAPLEIDDRTQEIFEMINEENYETYLELFESWYLKYHRLPRKKGELIKMGLPEELVGRFVSLGIRKQVKMLVIELYHNCDTKKFSAEFLKYVAKITYRGSGLLGRGIEYVKDLF